VQARDLSPPWISGDDLRSVRQASTPADSIFESGGTGAAGKCSRPGVSWAASRAAGTKSSGAGERAQHPDHAGVAEFLFERVELSAFAKNGEDIDFKFGFRL
jgi:hypothetical protein